MNARCPVCDTSFSFPSIRAHRTYPFCSERCRLLDLGAWFGETYQTNRWATEDELEQTLSEQFENGAPEPSFESIERLTGLYHDGPDAPVSESGHEGPRDAEGSIGDQDDSDYEDDEVDRSPEFDKPWRPRSDRTP